MLASGWIIQDKQNINRMADLGVGILDYQTEASPEDYCLLKANPTVS